MLADIGYWVHFIVPDTRGAQPFDIVAVKNGISYAIDCKTCISNTFNISRLEDNQIMAFERWIKCGNTDPVIVVEHNDQIYCVSYTALKAVKKCKLGGSNEKLEDCGNNMFCSFDDKFN